MGVQGAPVELDLDVDYSTYPEAFVKWEIIEAWKEMMEEKRLQELREENIRIMQRYISDTWNDPTNLKEMVELDKEKKVYHDIEEKAVYENGDSLPIKNN